MRRVGALILAAGGSTRLGEPKQFLLFEGETLLRRAAKAAIGADCTPVVIVAGGLIDRIRREVGDLPVTVLHNAQSHRGIGTSITCGVAELRSEADAIVILACDQPFASATTIRQLIAGDRPIVASGYSDTIGIPALFDARYFDALEGLAEDHGAKALIESHPEEVAVIDFNEGAIDIDTRSDYEVLISAAAATRADVRS